MRRAIVLLFPALMLLAAGLVLGQGRKEKRGEEGPGPAAKARPGKATRFFDVDEFLREHDRNKDGYLSKDELPERFRHNFDKLDTKFTQFTLAGSHEFNDQWKADFTAGHAKSDFRNPIQTTLTFDQLNVQNYSYDYTQGRVPLLSYGSTSNN